VSDSASLVVASAEIEGNLHKHLDLSSQGIISTEVRVANWILDVLKARHPYAYDARMDKRSDEAEEDIKIATGSKMDL
jgi:hypothetical protein